MGIIITDDIEQECLNIMSMYTDNDYIIKRILQSYSNLSDTKQKSVSDSIKSCIVQGNRFLKQTDDNILTAPLTLYYAICNYCRAIYLVNFPNLTSAGSHGLSLDNTMARDANEVGDIVCTVSRGTFKSLLDVTGDEIALEDSIKLKDIFSIIPELREIYFFRYFEEPNIFLLKGKKNCVSEYEPIIQGSVDNNLKVRDYSFLNTNGVHFEISDDKAYIWLDANCKQDKFDNVFCFDVYGNKYVCSGIEINGKKVKISKIACLYVAFYAFSMLVRYYPEKWSAFCDSSDSTLINKLLIKCRREMLVEVLELLNQDKYIFATKIEEKEADIDSSQLLKMIKSEVQDSIRRTGKNPLCM